MGIPLAWIETGGIEKIGKTFAEQAQESLDMLQENGTLELVDIVSPEAMFRTRLLIFLGTNLPDTVGTFFFNLQSEIAQALADFFGQSNYDS